VDWDARRGSWWWEMYHAMSMTERVVSYRPKRRPIRRITVKNHPLQAPTGKYVYCIFYKKSITPATQPIRNCHHPGLLHLSNGLLLKTPLPISSSFSIK